MTASTARTEQKTGRPTSWTVDWAQNLQDQGWSLARIAAEIKQEFGQDITAQGVGVRLRRAQRAKNVEPYAVTAERRLLPWRVKLAHRTTPVGRAVHLLVRKSKGVSLNRAELAEIQRFLVALNDLPGGDWVVTYKATRMAGYRFRRRKRTDEVIAGVIAVEA